MKDYYQILGVHREAGPEEIKRAYRKLAFLYHPDKNNTAYAQSIIQEINEAYDILGDSYRRQQYNYLYDYRHFVPPPAVKQPVHRKPRPYPGDHPPVQKRPRRNYARYVKPGKILAKIILAFIFILMLDYVLAITYHGVVVKRLEKIHDTHHIVHSDQGRFNILSSRNNYSKGDTLTIVETPLLQIVTEYAVEKKSKPVYDKDVTVENIYSPVLFIPFMLIFTCYMALRAKDPETMFNLSTFNVYLFGLFLIIMIW